MRPLLAALISLPMACLAYAADDFYPVSQTGYMGTNPSDEELHVINRTAMVLPSLNDGNEPVLESCMVAPAADWALAAKTEEIELKYLNIVSAALWRHEPVGVQVNGKDGRGGVISACGGRHSPGATVNIATLQDDVKKSCLHKMSAKFPGGKYASHGGLYEGPIKPIFDTLELYIKSPHEAVALRAMGIANQYKYSVKRLGKPLTDVVLDKTASEARRLRAIEVLTDIHSGEETAHALAHVWQDETASQKLRIAALNDTGLILSFGDMRLRGDPAARSAPPCGPDGSMCAKLKKYLIPAINLANAERDEKDKLTPLGEAAQCVFERYPKEWVKAARAGKAF